MLRFLLLNHLNNPLTSFPSLLSPKGLGVGVGLLSWSWETEEMGRRKRNKDGGR